jgi:hypothetical protein
MQIRSILVSFLCGAFVVVVGASALPRAARAVDSIDKAYVRSLAVSGKTVLVLEYYDENSRLVSRRGFTSASGFKAVSPTDIRIDERRTLHLYGVEPCRGEMVNRREGFSGACADFAVEQLNILLQSPKVLFCRAFLTNENSPVQDATCFGYYYFPGSLDAVDNLEEQLLSLGALRLSKKTDGTPLRPDLADGERIGRSGFGMWADPRIKGQ